MLLTYSITNKSKVGTLWCDVHNILTTVMTCIVVDKSTDHAWPHSICFLPQYQRQRKCFSSERELKKSLRAIAWHIDASSVVWTPKDFCCSNVSVLCYKTNGKCRSVYYWVMDALGRFAKHSRSKSRTQLSPRATLTLLSCLATSRVHHNSIVHAMALTIC